MDTNGVGRFEVITEGVVKNWESIIVTGRLRVLRGDRNRRWRPERYRYVSVAIPRGTFTQLHS
jgi:hypothetical protein